MKIFFDTFALFKLYHEETWSRETEEVLLKNEVSHLFLSEITKIEFISTVWKKIRMKEITLIEGKATIDLFSKDFPKYIFVSHDQRLLNDAQELISKYGLNGLRTLDSIQLATSLRLSAFVDLFVTTGVLLQSFLRQEGLRVAPLI